MMHFWYSKKQDNRLGANFVKVNGKTEKYTEITHDQNNSNYDDAVLICNRMEGDYSEITMGYKHTIEDMLYDDSYFSEDRY